MAEVRDSSVSRSVQPGAAMPGQFGDLESRRTGDQITAEAREPMGAFGDHLHTHFGGSSGSGSPLKSLFKEDRILYFLKTIASGDAYANEDCYEF